MSDGILEGKEVLDSQGGISGNQFAPGSNVYVNMVFAPNEYFTGFEFRTSGVAFELDNIWVGVTEVPGTKIPEPASLALVGLGCLLYTSRCV